MKHIMIIMTLIFSAQLVAADDSTNHEFLYGYLSGTYWVVGKKLDRTETYQGKVIFDGKSDHLNVTRAIQGEVVKGIGKIEHALGSDAVNVLRVRFKDKGQEFEITYLWRSDLDNYARLSGYVYQPGKQTDTPGLEALFIDHKSK